MKYSLYYSSGIESYIQQELDTLRFRFKDIHEKNNEWNSILYSALLKGEIATKDELIDQKNTPTYDEFKGIHDDLNRIGKV